MLEDRLKTAQVIITMMDSLLKENNMSLVVRNGKPVVLDHELDRIYKISNEDEILEHLVFEG